MQHSGERHRGMMTISTFRLRHCVLLLICLSSGDFIGAAVDACWCLCIDMMRASLQMKLKHAPQRLWGVWARLASAHVL